MAHESDSTTELKYDDMSASDLCDEVAKMLKVLKKKTKQAESSLSKLEAKKEKAAPVKGVRPNQLAQNGEWVAFVHAHILTNGWESFIHAERYGKGMADVEYPASELAEVEMDGETIQIHIFPGSDNEQPNLSHAMTLSKLYRTSKPDLYQEFLDQYVPPTPVEDAGRVVKPAAPRVTMTLEERKAEKARLEAKHKEDVAQRKKAREEKRAAEKAKKEEADRIAKAARDAAKGKTAPPKAAVNKRAPIPAASAKSILSSKSVPKPVVKPVAEWVPPKKGEFKEWKEPKSKTIYARDHLDRLFTMDANGDAEELAGWWNGVCIITDEDQIPKDD